MAGGLSQTVVWYLKPVMDYHKASDKVKKERNEDLKKVPSEISMLHYPQDDLWVDRSLPPIRTHG